MIGLQGRFGVRYRLAVRLAGAVFMIVSMGAVADDTKLTPEFLRQQSDDAFELWSKICYGNVPNPGEPEKKVEFVNLRPIPNDKVRRLLPEGLMSAWRRPGPQGAQGDIIVSFHSPEACTVTAIRADARYGSEKFLQRMKEQEASGVALEKIADKEVSVGNGNTRRMIAYRGAPPGASKAFVWTVTFTDSDQLMALILKSSVIPLPANSPTVAAQENPAAEPIDPREAIRCGTLFVLAADKHKGEEISHVYETAARALLEPAMAKVGQKKSGEWTDEFLAEFLKVPKEGGQFDKYMQDLKDQCNALLMRAVPPPSGNLPKSKSPTDAN